MVPPLGQKCLVPGSFPTRWGAFRGLIRLWKPGSFAIVTSGDSLVTHDQTTCFPELLIAPGSFPTHWGAFRTPTFFFPTEKSCQKLNSPELTGFQVLDKCLSNLVPLEIE